MINLTMGATIAKKTAIGFLNSAGIAVNGPNPWDIKVNNPGFYGRVLGQGPLGLGESYMDGWWDCDALDQFFLRVIKAKLQNHVKLSWPLIWGFVADRLNLQTIKRAFIVGEKHYDLGNDFFEAMLGRTMAYSCGYWQEAQTLDEAQEAKFDLICRKLDFKKGQRVLDIGCGWGSFARFAAEKYGVSVLGISVSKEQVKFAEDLCRGLPVEFLCQDYRSLEGKFDRIVSVGMFEHVGPKNYRVYMEVTHRVLKEDGLFLLHTIGSLRPDVSNPWIEKYIFPNGYLPTLKQVVQSAEGLFALEDAHNLGVYYDKTLMAWHKNFEIAWPNFKAKYGEKFYRMWRYYLLSCAAAFRANEVQVWQIVFSPNGVEGGYKSVR